LEQIEIENSSLGMLKKRMSNNNISDFNLVKIIGQTENTTTFMAPCSSQLFDELGNIYQIIGPYVLSCSEPIEFNYTDLIQVWHKCLCGK
jgi:hypothetical protein